MIGKIERLPLREVWKHEAQGLTKWLEENPDVLSDVTDLTLSSAAREQSAGDFNVDLVAEDEAGNPVIIENQLGKSDHDHLGKLVTYLTAVDAKSAIWIVADPRPEHVRAITWLNESSSASFYLLKLEAIRIGDSAPAPLLTLIVGPSDEARVAGEVKKELAEGAALRQRFWTELLQEAKGQTQLHASVSPANRGWASAGAGKAGLSFDYYVRQHDGQVYLWIGRADGGENQRIFETLRAAKATIEAAFGGPLEWKSASGRRSCVISHPIDRGGYRDGERWPQIRREMIDAMIRLEKALRPHIDKLKV
ncbi:MAG: DUF4268 domain-containing protein [Armatimonadetes bacterium]|nr:DUF4268 domain-containing protein [Armatimonadota bacterium]